MSYRSEIVTTAYLCHSSRLMPKVDRCEISRYGAYMYVKTSYTCPLLQHIIIMTYVCTTLDRSYGTDINQNDSLWPSRGLYVTIEYEHII